MWWWGWSYSRWCLPSRRTEPTPSGGGLRVPLLLSGGEATLISRPRPPRSRLLRWRPSAEPPLVGSVGPGGRVVGWCCPPGLLHLWSGFWHLPDHRQVGQPRPPQLWQELPEGRRKAFIGPSLLRGWGHVDRLAGSHADHRPRARFSSSWARTTRSQSISSWPWLSLLVSRCAARICWALRSPVEVGPGGRVLDLACTGFPPGSGRPASGWSEEAPAAWWAGGSCAPVRRSVERVVGHERPGRRRPPHGHQPRSRSAASLSASGFR